MKGKGTTCAKCHKPIPTRTVVYYRGAPLGPTCADVIRRRERLRSEGENRRVVKNEDTGLTHIVSDNGDVCPDVNDHCLQCSFLKQKECPVETKFALKMLENAK
jgi:hypothetical protein